MYTEGFVVAIVLGLVALLTPALWVAWWLIADLGEKVHDRPAAAPHKLPRAA